MIHSSFQIRDPKDESRDEHVVVPGTDALLRREGFTLLELLMVISIIALLSALLLPALSTAKEKGRRAACLSNLRQVAIATRLYMDDHEGSMFHHHEAGFWMMARKSTPCRKPQRAARVVALEGVRLRNLG